MEGAADMDKELKPEDLKVSHMNQPQFKKYIDEHDIVKIWFPTIYYIVCGISDFIMLVTRIYFPIVAFLILSHLI